LFDHIFCLCIVDNNQKRTKGNSYSSSKGNRTNVTTNNASLYENIAQENSTGKALKTVNEDPTKTVDETLEEMKNRKQAGEEQLYTELQF